MPDKPKQAIRLCKAPASDAGNRGTRSEGRAATKLRNSHTCAELKCPATVRTEQPGGITMRHLFDVAVIFGLGAALLVGLGLMISFTSTALELVALR